MDFKTTHIPYRQTEAFSAIACDYIDQAKSLQPFFNQPPSMAGILNAIEERAQFPTDRSLLVSHLQRQYDGIENNTKIKKNIESLLDTNTFTITTAHQPNILTGPLYFIYKIIHAIKLADELNTAIKGKHFVPVFYVGSEDADLDELNNVTIDGTKLVWDTAQTGAVGRMLIDKKFIAILDAMEAQLAVLPDGYSILSQLRKYYQEGVAVQDATFRFVHSLFEEYGLLILLADDEQLKRTMNAVFADDLLEQTPAKIVERTASQLSSAGYKVQANPREINLFYLDGDRRSRIIKKEGKYLVHETSLEFSKEEMLKLLEEHPERFSPNVILRGLYQEMILPNIAFIGGGGEVAYWLQLKELFLHYKVPFPVLLLRNSFLIVEEKWKERINKLNLQVEDFFKPELDLVNQIVKRDSTQHLQLDESIEATGQLFEKIKTQATNIDSSLQKHVDALKTAAIKKLEILEKKMLRAEKKKFVAQQRQLHIIKQQLFPRNGLQERVENIAPFYARYGEEIIHQLYLKSSTLQQEFTVLTIQ